MKSLNINKKYKVSIELEIDLNRVRDYSERIDLKKVTEEMMEENLLIEVAANNLGDSLIKEHVEEDSDNLYIDCLDFTVNKYKVNKIEEYD